MFTLSLFAYIQPGRTRYFVHRGGAFLPCSRQFHALIRRRRAVIVKARAFEYDASRNFLVGGPLEFRATPHLISPSFYSPAILWKCARRAPLHRWDAIVCVICNCVRELHAELTSGPIKFNDRWLRVRATAGRRQLSILLAAKREEAPLPSS